MGSIPVEGGFEVNRIIIISHLGADELRADERLYCDLEILQKAEEGLKVDLMPMKGIGELLVFLEKLPVACESFGIRPILHFEMHGDAERGLRLRDGFLSWRRLGEALRKINYATGNNLVVLMASCFGIRAYTEVVRFKALCPAWYFAAPFEAATAGELSDAYLRFYAELQRAHDSDVAEDASGLGMVCVTISSPAFFVRVVVEFFAKQCRGRERREWIEELVTMDQWLRGHPGLEQLRSMRAQAKEKCKPSREYFLQWATSFLHSPERLSCSWDDILKFLEGDF